MTVSATLFVVSTKYSIFKILFRVVYSYIASLRACVLASPMAVRAARQRVGCRHGETAAVAVSSMSYETAVQRCICLYESYPIIELYRYHIRNTRERF